MIIHSIYSYIGSYVFFVPLSTHDRVKTCNQPKIGADAYSQWVILLQTIWIVDKTSYFTSCILFDVYGWAWWVWGASSLRRRRPKAKDVQRCSVEAAEHLGYFRRETEFPKKWRPISAFSRYLVFLFNAESHTRHIFPKPSDRNATLVLIYVMSLENTIWYKTVAAVSGSFLKKDPLPPPPTFN